MHLGKIRISAAMAAILAGGALAGASAATATMNGDSARIPPVFAAHTAERLNGSTLHACRSRFAATMARVLMV